MLSLGDLATALNRSPVYLAGLQKRFELPALTGAAYSPAYLAFLRSLVALRALDIPEESLRDIWQLEKKLIQLLYFDSAGSRTWFLDACGATTHPERRLLLTNHDLGFPLTATVVQPGLNFANSAPELFAGTEMGEDALRVFRECLDIRAQILTSIAAELPNTRAAIKWATQLAKHP